MPAENSDLMKDFIELAGGGVIGSALRDLIGWLRGAKKDKAEAEAMLTDAQTRMFTAIRESYDSRVVDLTSEIHKLRDEVISLRQAYDTQQKNHAEQMLALQQAHAEQMAALRDELDEARSVRGFGG